MRTKAENNFRHAWIVAMILFLAFTFLQCPSWASDESEVPEGLQNAVNFGGEAAGYFDADPGDIMHGPEDLWETDLEIDVNSVSNAAPKEVYQSGIFSDFRYTLHSPDPNRRLDPGEKYLVRLHFNETIADQPEKRQCDFFINQSQIMFRYDVYEVAGTQNRAVTEDILVRADEYGTLVLDFEPSEDKAPVGVAGLEFLQYIEKPPPAAWWTFDELAGPSARDAAGTRNATIEGATRTVGRISGALDFDGIDDYVWIGDANDIKDLFAETFSFSCWIRGTPSASYGRVIASLKDGQNLLMTSHDNGLLETELGGRGRITVSEINVTDGVWHHILTVFDVDGEQLSFYVDGIQISNIHPLLPPIGNCLYIGTGSSLGEYTFWAGSIDDFRVYDRVLTHEEILRLWEKTRRVQTDFYYIGPNERVPVMIDRDKVGALPFRDEGGVGDGAIRTFSKKVGLEILYTLHPSGIIIEQLPERQEPQSRLELAGFARQTALIDDYPFEFFGLVVTPGQDEIPMLLTDEFIAKFTPDANDAQIKALNDTYGVEIVEQNQYQPKQYLLKVTWNSEGDALEISNVYHKHPLIEYAHPNFVMAVDLHGHIPNDTLFTEQWHLNNTGQGGGTPDADIDAPEAWEITIGDPNIVIAVIDGGFDTNHPDLQDNLWRNPAEMLDGQDNDDNNLIDDIHGWNFIRNEAHLSSPLNSKGVRHGTAAAGCAGAKGDNLLGVSGTCQSCKLMLLKAIRPGQPYTAQKAIEYAHYHGADIITNSWSFQNVCTFNLRQAIKNAAENGRNDLGCVVLFAMDNDNEKPDCYEKGETTLNEVISISASNNKDSIKDILNDEKWGGFGNCMDVLAPTHRGTRWIVTADIQNEEGYNWKRQSVNCPSIYLNDHNYTSCFLGSSAACPITAGVVGLILSANANLTRLEVQRLLQDTADKIEDSMGRYSPISGFSRGPDGIATHGYGRINAFEAVQVVASQEAGGRGGVDIFLRDNRLDWGNTEQPSHMLFEPTRGFIPYWESMDIKVDAPPYQTPPTDSISFDAIVHENPKKSETNYIYVRVRNRGHIPASNIDVKLYECPAGTAFPATTQWNLLGTEIIEELKYSGCSVAGTNLDAAQIVSFDFHAPEEPNNYCFLAVANCSMDPASIQSPSSLLVDTLTPNNNNVTQLNVVMIDATQPGESEVLFFLRNPYDEDIHVKLDCDAPSEWKIFLDNSLFDAQFETDLAAGQEMWKLLRIEITEANAEGDVILKQIRQTSNGNYEIMGGLTCRFRPI